MGSICWPYFDPEYETLELRINPPRVSVDNASCSKCTLIKVDSVNKPGILLEVVQVITNLDLVISKAYISSDGGWFMDVFHVTDRQANKLTDVTTVEQIEKALRADGSPKSVSLHSIGCEYTTFELIGKDRPGLLSEITAILAEIGCNVAAADVWTHNNRVACVLYVTDVSTARPLNDPDRIALAKERLESIVGGKAETMLSVDFNNTDRRLHKLLSDDNELEAHQMQRGSSSIDHLDVEEAAAIVAFRNTSSIVVAAEKIQENKNYKNGFTPEITVERCVDKGYWVINIKCKDRAKLLFDTVFTLTDMKYVVSHASLVNEGPFALQEFYIRPMNDGCTLATDVEKQRLIKRLEAAIQRRASEGVSLELIARDRVGLLSDVTRILRENGLSVTRADVSTVAGKAVNVFYVSDNNGNPVDLKTVESLKKEIGETILFKVTKSPDLAKPTQPPTQPAAKFSFSFGNFLGRFLA